MRPRNIGRIDGAVAAGRFGLGVILCLLVACAHRIDPTPPADAPVLFVCEHGNVKSLMAAAYFNRLAAERGLKTRAVSRGVAPDATTVPPAIARALQGDGFDVTGFHPEAISAGDVASARRVIAIGADIPASAMNNHVTVQQWNDIPPASVDYPAARDALMKHIDQLVDELSGATPR